MAHVLNARTLRQWAPLLILVALCLGLSLISPTFLTLRNVARLGVGSAPSMLIAVGVTFVIIMGSIDLSMEGTVALCCVVLATILVKLGGVAGWGWVAIPGALVTGIVMGIVNGVLHVKLKIPSFMASLGMGFVGLGATFIVTGGGRLTITDRVFRALLTERFFELPLMIYVAFAALAVACFIERRTVLGRHFYAVGGGEELARASGLNVDRIRILGFGLAGLFFALGAIMTAARLGIADGDSGTNLMFVSITAVIVGGTPLVGGSGGVLQTLVGVLIVAVISNGMIVLGLPTYLQSGVLGLMVLLAVGLSIDRKSILFAK